MNPYYSPDDPRHYISGYTKSCASSGCSECQNAEKKAEAYKAKRSGVEALKSAEKAMMDAILGKGPAYIKADWFPINPLPIKRYVVSPFEQGWWDIAFTVDDEYTEIDNDEESDDEMTVTANAEAVQHGTEVKSAIDLSQALLKAVDALEGKRVTGVVSNYDYSNSITIRFENLPKEKTEAQKLREAAIKAENAEYGEPKRPADEELAVETKLDGEALAGSIKAALAIAAKDALANIADASKRLAERLTGAGATVAA